ncbi:MAG: HRDC domain-containing protein [Anaerolineaceae bacterium]
MEPNQLSDPIWVATSAALEKMVFHLNAQPSIAVDTESNSLFAYQEQVCLIQFSTPDTDYLVDPLALKDLSILAPIFADAKIEKIFHAAEYDLICLRRDFHFTFANLFDTMQAARILGRDGVGLGSLLEAEFGLQLDKRYQRANWGIRPLPPAQLAYARLDTHYLFALRERMEAALVEAGRMELAKEDFLRLCRPVENNNSGERENSWHISGSKELTPQQMAILHELCTYRDDQARSANLPPFKIMSNQALVEIAELEPRLMEELYNLQNLHPRQIQRHGAQLLKVVARGLEATPLRRRHTPRPDDAILARLEALRIWRRDTGKKLGVESDIILPRDAMFNLAEANPRSMDDIRAVMGDLPYRAEQFGDKILHALHI